MKQDPFVGVYRALSPEELAQMFMNPNSPKTEAEHWAVREIEKLRAEVDRLQSKVDTAKGIIEKLLTVMPVFPRGYTPSPHNPYDVAIESARTFLEKPHD